MNPTIRHGTGQLTLENAFSKAVNYHQAGNLVEAENLYTQILQHVPDHPDTLHYLGVIADQKGNCTRAVELIQRSLSLKPKNSEAHNNLGMALQAIGERAQALVSFQQAVELDPGFPQAWYCIGWMQKELGNLAAAAHAYRQATTLAPDYAEAHYNLGNVYLALYDYDQAEAAFERAIALQPAKAEAHYNMGITHYGQGKVEEARASFARGLALKPSPAIELFQALMQPPIPTSIEDIAQNRERAENALKAALENNQRLDDALQEYGHTNFYLTYHGKNNRHMQEMLAQLYLKANPELAWTAPHCHDYRPKSATEKLRLGIILAHRMDHTIGKFVRGIIQNLPRDRFEIVLFTLPGKTTIQQPQPVADKEVILTQDLKIARQQIAEARPDILFYPDIGMEAFTYFLAFARLAPVQCVTWGHPDTTGIPNMDYFISSELIEPDNTQDCYSEKLIRLKELPTYYFRPAATASTKTRSDYNLEENAHLYLCPQSLFKLHPEFDTILAKILERDAQAHIALIAGSHPHWTELLKQRLARTVNNNMNRIHFLPQLSHPDFLHLLTLCDVMLDPLHFGGGNTTYEALALGVPIITLPGTFMCGRVTLGCYKAMDMMDLVAHDADHYVDLAVNVAVDPRLKESLKSKILSRNSCLYERQEAIQELAQFFETSIHQQ